MNATPQALAQRAPFARELARWRRLRGYSQLRLAHACEISQKHLSYLELGRARPSRAMVLTLAGVLGLTAHERDALLHAAGFAATGAPRAPDEHAMGEALTVLEMMLAHQDPNPAIVVDRDWRLLRGNAAMARALQRLGHDTQAWRQSRASPHNVLELPLHPAGLRPRLVDARGVAQACLARVAQARLDDDRPALADLESRLRDTCADLLPARAIDPAAAMWPTLPLDLRADEGVLRLALVCTSFGTRDDPRHAWLRIETLLPRDATTRALLAAWSGDEITITPPCEAPRLAGVGA